MVIIWRGNFQILEFAQSVQYTYSRQVSKPSYKLPKYVFTILMVAGKVLHQARNINICVGKYLLT